MTPPRPEVAAVGLSAEQGAIADIVAGLTKAQRNALVGKRSLAGAGCWPLRHALAGKGLTAGWHSATVTPLGLAVRTAILDQEKGNG